MLFRSSFHNLGVGSEDPGRGFVVKDQTLKGAFKTPGLRNVLLTAPYMHDGSMGTLEEVMHFYNRGGGEAENKSDLIKPLNLSQLEILDLLAFMGTLTDVVEMDVPVLPPGNPKVFHMEKN